MAVNVILKFIGAGCIATVRQVKYLNNILEQDHRFIKRITGPPLAVCRQTSAGQRLMGFKAFHSAAATVAQIELAHVIR